MSIHWEVTLTSISLKGLKPWGQKRAVSVPPNATGCSGPFPSADHTGEQQSRGTIRVVKAKFAVIAQ
jgi:hypothetical protein